MPFTKSRAKIEVDSDKLADLGATLADAAKSAKETAGTAASKAGDAASHAKDWTTPKVEQAIDWLLPRAEFHAYLGALVRAGLGKRLMFGSDHMYWPEAIGLAVEGVESATFLTPEEKRDIFHGNAVRFFRLEPATGGR